MYYLIIDEKQVGPVPFEQLTTYGIGPDTMVWKEGMPQWAPASTLQELTPLFNTGAPFSGNPYGQPQQPCQQPWQQPYQQQQQPWQQPGQPGQPWQSWQPQSNYERKSQYMTLAIIGTVLGLFSCLGLIFGIIAITKANSANKFYAMGDEVTAASNNSSARTFSIIALVLDGLGILISLIALGS